VAVHTLFTYVSGKEIISSVDTLHVMITYTLSR